MKIGSIVVVKPYRHNIPKGYIKFLTWLPVEDQKTPYMIRGIYHVDGYITVTLEEGVFGWRDGGEIGLKIEYVREVDPPESIQEIIKALEPEMVET